MTEVISQIFPLFAVLIVTYFLKRIKFVKRDEMNSTATKLAFDIVMPVLLFEVFSAATLSLSDIVLPIITITFALLSLAGIFILDKIFSVKNKLLIFVAFTGLNVAPIYPLVQLNYSPDLFSKFVLLDLGALIILFTLTLNIASLATKKKDGTNFFDALKQIFWNPVMAAILLGVGVNLLNITIPELISDTTKYISASFGFLVSFIVGLSFEFPKKASEFTKVLGFYAFRIILAVLFTILVVNLLSPSQDLKEIVLLILSTPFAMLTVVYAEKYRLNSTYASQLVTVSLFIQILLLPFVVWLGSVL